MKLSFKTKWIIVGLALILPISCTQSRNFGTKNDLPKNKISVSIWNSGKLPSSVKVQEILKNSQEDFNLIISGQKPKNAKSDGSVMLDGGTVKYKGVGYNITVQQRIGSAGDIFGYYYGPILTFIDEAFTGEKVISQVTFYTREELVKLKGGEGNL